MTKRMIHRMLRGVCLIGHIHQAKRTTDGDCVFLPRASIHILITGQTNG